ncbi:MAG: lytic transglycosylase domain-containing protein [Solirubrobacterales bacterium]
MRDDDSIREQRSGRDDLVRAVGGVLLLVVAAAIVAAIPLALGLGEREPLDARVAGIAGEASAAADPQNPSVDPLAWDPPRRERFEARAATGASHVIYAKSPGGAIASARRTAAWRDEIEAAAGRHGVDPDTVEAVIFLESAGRPEVTAGPTPEAASGLAQIIPSTATELLGMSVDLERSVAITKRIAKAESAAEAKRLRAERAAVDQRFNPEAAIDGAATYLEIARERFGADDLAIASYHMGIGNLENVIRAYAGDEGEGPIGALVAADALTYAQLYFDSSPDSHREAHELLTGFGDESSDYLWKVRASEGVMRLYRNDSDRLVETAALATAKATLEEVFHPEEETEVFEDPGDLEAALRDGHLVPLPVSSRLGWLPANQMGELAPELDQPVELYRALRPEALATLGYLAQLVRELSGSSAALRISSTVRDLSSQELLAGDNPEATNEYSLHTTGWSFDVLRRYENGRQAEAFQFVLDRLSALALIDYAVEPAAIHVTVSELGRELLREEP